MIFRNLLYPSVARDGCFLRRVNRLNPTSGAMAMTKTVRWQRMERIGGLPNSLEQQAKLVDLISQVVEKKDSLSVLFDALTSVEAFNKGICQAASRQYPTLRLLYVLISRHCGQNLFNSFKRGVSATLNIRNCEVHLQGPDQRFKIHLHPPATLVDFPHGVPVTLLRNSVVPCTPKTPS